MNIAKKFADLEKDVKHLPFEIALPIFNEKLSQLAEDCCYNQSEIYDLYTQYTINNNAKKKKLN